MLKIANTDLSKIGYYYAGSGQADVYRPTNIGFGVTYVLPVILALLKAETGSIVVLENPECHLHPKGQRMIGELIARCVSSGVQIFLETHSDHVLNGIRIAAKKELINHEDVALFFISRPIDSCDKQSIIQQPKILKNGKLDFWPDDFFDEWEKALDDIL